MSEYSNILRGMINNADDEVDSLNDATAQIIIQIEDLEDKRDAIEYGVLDIAAIDLSSYLEITKLVEVGGDYVSFGADYNVINLTDWGIYRNPATLIYSYGDDSDPNIIEFVNNWNFGRDFIDHSFGISGTFGLQAKIDQLYDAFDLIISNKSKIEDSKTVFENYAS